MKKIDIIQFSPYYPPHIGGVEKVVQDIHENWEYGDSIVITSDIGQHSKSPNANIFFYPTFELVANFPVPKFWKRSFWNALGELQYYIGSNTIVITHTRFFVSSFIGALYAKMYKLDSVHIEHGSGYVLSGNTVIDFFSKIYDKTLGKFTLLLSQKKLAISKASKLFLKEKFKLDDVGLWYRGIPIVKKTIKKSGKIQLVYVGRLTGLKQVPDLIQAYKNIGCTQRLTIIGDGPKKKQLEQEARGLNINFLGQRKNNEIINFLQENRCIIINPSAQEGLPTTVIEGLMTKNVIIATDVGGTSEISLGDDLLLYNSGDISALENFLTEAIQHYEQYAGLSFNHVSQNFCMKNSIKNLYKHLQ